MGDVPLGDLVLLRVPVRTVRAVLTPGTQQSLVSGWLRVKANSPPGCGDRAHARTAGFQSQDGPERHAAHRGAELVPAVARLGEVGLDLPDALPQGALPPARVVGASRRWVRVR